jgi:hypothetical protein
MTWRSEKANHPEQGEPKHPSQEFHRYLKHYDSKSQEQILQIHPGLRPQ